MITTGTLIKMVHPITGFDMVGEVFEVVKVLDDGVISFKAPFGVGVMSANECTNHFEVVQKSQPKQPWTDWIVGCCIEFGEFQYKTNGRRVKVRFRGHQAESACHPDDEFNLSRGVNIALARSNLKHATARCKHFLGVGFVGLK